MERVNPHQTAISGAFLSSNLRVRVVGRAQKEHGREAGFFLFIEKKKKAI